MAWRERPRWPHRMGSHLPPSRPEFIARGGGGVVEGGGQEENGQRGGEGAKTDVVRSEGATERGEGRRGRPAHEGLGL